MAAIPAKKSSTVEKTVDMVLSTAVEEVTETWLKVWLGIPFTLVMAGGDTGANKIEIIEEWGIKYYVEDRFKTVGKLADVIEGVFMPDRPWNTGRTHMGFDNIYRINNLIDVVYKLGELEGWDIKE